MNSLTPLTRKGTIGPKVDHQLQVLFDHIQVAKICMLDKSGKIISWNNGAERLTGYAAAEVVGKYYSIFLSPEDRRTRAIEKALKITASNGELTTDGIRLKKNGTHFWARSHFTYINGDDGAIKFFVVMTRDITQEREGTLRREEYIGIASHELKNPITTLSLYSEILAKRLELEKDKKNLLMLRDIQMQASRLSSLVDDLLIVSKAKSGPLDLHKEVFKVAIFLNALVRDFKHGGTIQPISVTAEEHLEVRADKSRIAQVVINLLTNAVKYAAKGQKIHIKAKRVGKKCIISVRDRGRGIAKKDQRELFTRFFRAQDARSGDIAGSGLGLYISKQIIKNHRERIWVESVVGKGSTFSFTLSLAR